LNRRTLLGLCAGAGFGIAPRALSAQSRAIRIATVASESAGAAFYAQDEGFFAKRGLVWQLTTSFAGGAAMASAILGGDLDIGEADVVTMAIAHDKELPFVYLAPGEVHSVKYPTLACVVRDAEVRLGKDFNEKVMACNVSRGYGSLVTNAWIDNNGGDSSTVKWVEFPFSALPAALQRGTIDGYCAPEPFVTAGIAAGGHLVLMNEKPIAPTILQGGWFATRRWTEENPAETRAFADAIREANEWGNKNLQARAEILAKYSKMALAVVLGMRLRGQYEVQFELSTVQPLIDKAAAYGYISKRFLARELISERGDAITSRL
jgi:NitT/TauT family transport system substrate-binding protein